MTPLLEKGRWASREGRNYKLQYDGIHFLATEPSGSPYRPSNCALPCLAAQERPTTASIISGATERRSSRTGTGTDTALIGLSSSSNAHIIYLPIQLSRFEAAVGTEHACPGSI